MPRSLWESSPLLPHIQPAAALTALGEGRCIQALRLIHRLSHRPSISSPLHVSTPETEGMGDSSVVGHSGVDERDPPTLELECQDSHY